jgi:hypothetical protein
MSRTRLDFMIPFAWAKPPIGMAIYVRRKRNDDVDLITYNGGEGHSWIHSKICECSNDRWDGPKDLTCTKCETIWKKPQKVLDKTENSVSM